MYAFTQYFAHKPITFMHIPVHHRMLFLRTLAHVLAQQREQYTCAVQCSARAPVILYHMLCCLKHPEVLLLLLQLYL
jgi:hypothetical protein